MFLFTETVLLYRHYSSLDTGEACSEVGQERLVRTRLYRKKHILLINLFWNSSDGYLEITLATWRKLKRAIHFSKYQYLVWRSHTVQFTAFLWESPFKSQPHPPHLSNRDHTAVVRIKWVNMHKASKSMSGYHKLSNVNFYYSQDGFSFQFWLSNKCPDYIFLLLGPTEHRSLRFHLN
jgi:hypothetical protein